MQKLPFLRQRIFTLVYLNIYHRSVYFLVFYYYICFVDIFDFSEKSSTNPAHSALDVDSSTPRRHSSKCSLSGFVYCLIELLDLKCCVTSTRIR